MILPGRESMARIVMNWDRSQFKFDTNPALKRFERWLTDRGYRAASIDDYLKAVGLYLRTLETFTPSIEDAKEYHSNKASFNLARSTVNIRRAALIAFYRSQGLELELPYLKPNNQVPYFFDENDFAAILNSCTNFKHYVKLDISLHATGVRFVQS